MGAIVVSPTRLAAANTASGSINTGELPLVRGGTATFSCLSGYNSGTILGCSVPRTGAVGISGDILVYSGAGRLNQLWSLNLAASGINIQVYDAAYAMSGGPYPTSGHMLLGSIQGCAWQPGVSGFAFPWTGAPVDVDVPFNSGLCVQVRSGQAPFMVSFTPENNPNFQSGGGLKG